MIAINKELCTGCGRCVKNCVGSVLTLQNGKAAVTGRCIVCGHCVAICPTKAVSIPEFDMADVKDYAPTDVALDPIKLLSAIKFRRSVRDYKPARIESETLNLVLQAGRYTATAKNTQACRFIVVQDELEHLKEMVWDGIGEALKLPQEEIPIWAKVLRRLYQAKVENPQNDFLFRNAPAVLFIATNRMDDAGLAAQSMELEAISLGLGMLYDGYVCEAANGIPAVREWLGTGDKRLSICALIGYPAVTFLRNAPRRPGDFILK